MFLFQSCWFIQISLTPCQVATDVCQALEYSTWKAHVHTNQRIPTPDSWELLSENIWWWHTQYTHTRSPFSRTEAPQIACYLAVAPLSGAMGSMPWGYSDYDHQLWNKINLFYAWCKSCLAFEISEKEQDLTRFLRSFKIHQDLLRSVCIYGSNNCLIHLSTLLSSRAIFQTSAVLSILKEQKLQHGWN